MDFIPLLLDSVDSTNNYAVNLISKSNPTEGTVIMTYNQTNGKGQIGRAWFSDKQQNITSSIIIYPNFLKIQEQFFLSVVLSLALFDTINALTTNSVYIKWPNDIYVDDLKIAGLLIQLGLQKQNIKYCVCGIGLNVNQFEFPSELPNPISLHQLTDKKYDLYEMNSIIFENFFKYYSRLKAGERQSLLHDYNNKLYRKNTPTIYYDNNGIEILLTPIYIKDSGLLVGQYKGEIQEFNLRQLRMKI